MNLQLFLSTPSITFFSILSGCIFGFLLRKGGVSRFDVIIGQFLLKDFTVMKVMFTAIVFGSIGIFTLHFIGIIPKLILSTTPLLLSAIGGSIFGIGMSLSGFCPGTGIAALAEGSKDVLFGLAGMLFGSILFNELSDQILPLLNQKDLSFQQTISSYYNLPNTAIIGCLVVFWLVFYKLLDGSIPKKSAA